MGIDRLSFYTPPFMLDLKELAKARNIDVDKYYIGLGQQKMSVPSPDEDIVTMAANAAARVLRDIDKSSIELLLFATESGIDQSKSAGIYVHDLLALSERCRVIELKQACYSATAALQLALPYLREHPDKKVLLIASDVARYGLETTGESSQGAGAVAMVLSAHPRLLALETEFGVVTESVMDFWRPNYADAALVDGKYSSKLYITMLEKTWAQYCALSKRTFSDHDYFCYHAPVPKLVEKAHSHLAKLNNVSALSTAMMQDHIQYALDYGRRIGNSYTASLYIGLASLLESKQADLSGQRIGFYSYGSGCVAEYFSGVIQPGYQSSLETDYHQAMLAQRKAITYAEYEQFYTFQMPHDGRPYATPACLSGAFRLAGIQDHKRIYEAVL